MGYQDIEFSRILIKLCNSIFLQRQIIVLISFLLLGGFKGFAQEIVIPKDTLYLDYSYYFKNCQHSDILDKLKWKKENGIQFNLCGEAILFYPHKGDSETLEIRDLQDYHFTELKHLDSLGRQWYRKNLNLLQKKWGKIFPPHDKNGKYVTYLIEEQESYFKRIS
ncbi:hypothetical protein [Psychroflexus halocasei]|uniref:hypothetical protein n=1 Tax=Psychroflexus halocasei TaxID=908615 RepID=UPI000B881351|nr:hypothetical protein [Psychroflexus halocasei]